MHRQSCQSTYGWTKQCRYAHTRFQTSDKMDGGWLSNRCSDRRAGVLIELLILQRRCVHNHAAQPASQSLGSAASQDAAACTHRSKDIVCKQSRAATAADTVPCCGLQRTKLVAPLCDMLDTLQANPHGRARRGKAVTCKHACQVPWILGILQQLLDLARHASWQPLACRTLSHDEP